MKIIFLIMIGLSLLQAEYIRDDTKEVVFDTTTNLMWQDDNATTLFTYTWTNAISQCENLNLGGFSDWRLPNFNELYLLLDKSVFNPAISPVFTNVLNMSYWSSTSYAANTSSAWGLDFIYGYYSAKDKALTFYVRCVR